MGVLDNVAAAVARGFTDSELGRRTVEKLGPRAMRAAGRRAIWGDDLVSDASRRLRHERERVQEIDVDDGRREILSRTADRGARTVSHGVQGATVRKYSAAVSGHRVLNKETGATLVGVTEGLNIVDDENTVAPSDAVPVDELPRSVDDLRMALRKPVQEPGGEGPR